MDLLAAYDSDSAEDERAPEQPPPPPPPPRPFLPSAAQLFGATGPGGPAAPSPSKKRGATSATTVQLESKAPRGQPVASKGLLLPPQLKGRSNIATVDLEGMGMSGAGRMRRPT